jgi:hypothetical protein
LAVRRAHRASTAIKMMNAGIAYRTRFDTCASSAG